MYGEAYIDFAYNQNFYVNRKCGYLLFPNLLFDIFVFENSSWHKFKYLSQNLFLKILNYNRAQQHDNSLHHNFLVKLYFV